MDKLYVIKFDNGDYYCGYNHTSKQLRKALIYKSLKYANDAATDFKIRNDKLNLSYKIVEVEIKEVEE